MKKIISIFSFLFMIGFSFATTTYHTNTENGKKYQVMKVVLDGKSKIVVPALEKGAKSLEGLMKDAGGIHAINGGFFCPDEVVYSWCGRGTTDGLRVSNGVLYSKWGMDIAEGRSVFGFDQNSIPLKMAEKSERTWDQSINHWRNNSVLAIYNGIMMPTLVKDGVNVAVFNTEMNSDGKQKAVGNKTFICSTKDNSTIYMGFVDGVTFSSLADYIIKTFSCHNAIQLDNGGTKAMIYDGKYVAGPGRNMMDAFVIIEEKGIGASIPSQKPNEPENKTNDSKPQEQSKYSEELTNAVSWLHEAGLSIFDNPDSFMHTKGLRRDEAAKFFVNFAKAMGKTTEVKSSKECKFKDNNKSWSDLRDIIEESCRLGIFQGRKGNFSPTKQLTNAEAVTVLIRIMFGMMDESKAPFYTNYLLKAQELGFVSNVIPNNNIQRGESAIIIYRANNYNRINLNSKTYNEDESTLDFSACSNQEILDCLVANNFETCISQCSSK